MRLSGRRGGGHSVPSGARCPSLRKTGAAVGSHLVGTPVPQVLRPDAPRTNVSNQRACVALPSPVPAPAWGADREEARVGAPLAARAAHSSVAARRPSVPAEGQQPPPLHKLLHGRRQTLHARTGGAAMQPRQTQPRRGLCVGSWSHGDSAGLSKVEKSRGAARTRLHATPDVRLHAPAREKLAGRHLPCLWEAPQRRVRSQLLRPASRLRPLLPAPCRGSAPSRQRSDASGAALGRRVGSDTRRVGRARGWNSGVGM